MSFDSPADGVHLDATLEQPLLREAAKLHELPGVDGDADLDSTLCVVLEVREDIEAVREIGVLQDA